MLFYYEIPDEVINSMSSYLKITIDKETARNIFEAWVIKGMLESFPESKEVLEFAAPKLPCVIKLMANILENAINE